MSQKLFVEHSHANCPNCNTDLEIIVPKGNGTKTRQHSIHQKVQGIKKEIIEAYLRDPAKQYTTREIILRINYIRFTQKRKALERSNLTRPHSELVGDGIIIDLKQVGYDHIYRIDEAKARKLQC